MSYIGGVLTLIPVSKMFLQSFLLVRFSSKTASLDCKVKDRTKTNNICEELFNMSSYIFHSSRNSIPNIFHFYHWAQICVFFISQGGAFSDADRPRLGEAPICGWL